MSVRKRRWFTRKGKSRSAFIVDYVDGDGVRRMQTFGNKPDAVAFWALSRQEALERDLKHRRISPAQIARSMDDADLPLWGAAAIAAVIGKSTSATHQRLKWGQLPATKIGGRWVSTRRRLLSFFGGQIT